MFTCVKILIRFIAQHSNSYLNIFQRVGSCLLHLLTAERINDEYSLMIGIAELRLAALNFADGFANPTRTF